MHASRDGERNFGSMVKKTDIGGPYSSEKSINGSDKAINGHHSSDKVITGSHDSDKAIRDPMQCNDKTSVVDYH